MTTKPTDYLTVSGHISGAVAVAFKRANPERGDASKYVRRAVEKLLESDGLMTMPNEHDDIHAAVDAILENAGIPADQILTALSDLTRQQTAASA